MAYNALNNLIDAYIYANGVQAITGQILNGVLKQMVAQLGSGYHLMGVAGPETVPASNDYAMAYFAATAGEYTDFGGITLAAGEVAALLTSGNGSWEKQTIYNVPTTTEDLENTAGFITNAVTDLVNYYTKTEMDDTLANYPTLEALATALADYYTKQEIDTTLEGYPTKQDQETTLGDYYTKDEMDAALGDRYTKDETDTKLAEYYKKTETYDKDEVDSIVAALSRQEYIVAWDGLSSPDISAIPDGVTVTYSGTTYTGTLAASASTVNKIYMVWNGIAYDMYGTSQDGGYSWVPMGTTSVDLSQYATKAEVSQLEAKVDGLSVDVGTWSVGSIGYVSDGHIPNSASNKRLRTAEVTVDVTGKYKLSCNSNFRFSITVVRLANALNWQYEQEIDLLAGDIFRVILREEPDPTNANIYQNFTQEQIDAEVGNSGFSMVCDGIKQDLDSIHDDIDNQNDILTETNEELASLEVKVGGVAPFDYSVTKGHQYTGNGYSQYNRYSCSGKLTQGIFNFSCPSGFFYCVYKYISDEEGEQIIGYTSEAFDNIKINGQWILSVKKSDGTELSTADINTINGYGLVKEFLGVSIDTMREEVQDQLDTIVPLGRFEVGTLSMVDGVIVNSNSNKRLRSASLMVIGTSGLYELSCNPGFKFHILITGQDAELTWDNDLMLKFNAGESYRIILREDPDPENANIYANLTQTQIDALVVSSGIKLVSKGELYKDIVGDTFDFSEDKRYINTSGVVSYMNNYKTTPLIPVKEGDVFFYSGGCLTNGIAVAGYDIGGDLVTVLVPGKTNYYYESKSITIPSTVSSIRACAYTPQGYSLFGGGEISKQLSYIKLGNGVGGDVEDVPETPGAAMVVRKAVEMVKVSTYVRNTLLVPGSNKQAGDTLVGLPYSSTRVYNTLVPNNVSFETFMSAMTDPNSKAYADSDVPGSSTTARLYYGEVCAPFAQYCLGIKVMRGMNWTLFTIPGMEKVAVQDAQYAKIGDIINVGTSTSTHCKVVIGITRENGVVKFVTVAESISPVCRIVKQSAQEFNNSLSEYTLMRYSHLDENTYDPTGNPFNQFNFNRNIMPNLGNKANYGKLDSVIIDILDIGSYTGYVLVKDGKPGSTVSLSNDATTINLGVLGYGKYSLYLTDGTNNSPSVEWIVVDYDVTVTARSGGVIRFEFSSKNALPIGTYWCREDYMPTIVREITPADLLAGMLDTQLSSTNIMVANDARYADAQNEVEKYGSLTEIYGRVLFRTEFGVYTSPQPATPVEIQE